MTKQDHLQFFEELDETENTEDMLKKNKHRLLFTPRSPRRMSESDRKFISAQNDSVHAFQFTYKAARFEEGWLLDSLGYFYEQGWISDVLRKVRTGKEASVYLCRSGEQVDVPLVAAKVYRPRMLRNLHNDHIYQEGRIILDEDGHEVNDVRMLHAVITRTNFGEQVRHQSWIAHEYTTLRALFAAGADVPKPYEMAHNAILMDYLGDERSAAPTLNAVTPDPMEVRPLYERLLRNVEIMLALKIVHGDLSAYNVLYWGGEITLIDFPQVVSPAGNRNAYAIFERDITRLCDYFIGQGLSLQPHRLAADLWTRHEHRLAAEIHPRALDPDDPQDRHIWQQHNQKK